MLQKQQADTDLDRRWSLLPGPVAGAGGASAQHIVEDPGALQREYVGQNRNSTWNVDLAAGSSSDSVIQTGTGLSFPRDAADHRASLPLTNADLADSWGVNDEARGLPSFRGPTIQAPCQESHFPADEVQLSMNATSGPSHTVSSARSGMLSHPEENR